MRGVVTTVTAVENGADARGRQTELPPAAMLFTKGETTVKHWHGCRGGVFHISSFGHGTQISYFRA